MARNLSITLVLFAVLASAIAIYFGLVGVFNPAPVPDYYDYWTTVRYQEDNMTFALLLIQFGIGTLSAMFYMLSQSSDELSDVIAGTLVPLGGNYVISLLMVLGISHFRLFWFYAPIVGILAIIGLIFLTVSGISFIVPRVADAFKARRERRYKNIKAKRVPLSDMITDDGEIRESAEGPKYRMTR